MYATAQHLRSPKGKDGINAFRYTHEGLVLDWRVVEMTELVGHRKGRLVSKELAIPPGGNFVISYLELAGDDDTPMIEIEGALRQARGNASRGERLRFGSLQVEFFLNSPEGDALGEYDTLTTTLLSLFSGPSRARGAPLTILVTGTADQTIFSLDSASMMRLARMKEPGWHAANVSVSRDVQSDLEALHGDSLSYIVQLITGLDRDALFDQGGVVLVDGRTARRLAAWPPQE